MLALPCTLGVFGLILVLGRLKVPLAAAILAGAVAQAVLLGLGAGELAAAAAEGAVRPTTVSLVIVTILLLALSQTMEAGGQMTRIVDLARRLVRRRAIAMAALPALIGLLPMPGGALFSAPMVESAAGQATGDRGMLSAVNYWFRHIWEHWWPLYPGVMLAVMLVGGDLAAFIAFQIPLGLSMAVSGLWIFRGSHPSLRAAGEPPQRGTGRKLLWATSSIWIILVVWGAAMAGALAIRPGAVAGAYETVVRKHLPLILGLLVSLVWTARLNRLGAAVMRKILTRGSIYRLAILVLSVMIFQAVLEKVDAAPRIARELTGLRFPVALVVAALPFIAGAVTGLAVGFVGTSFPIVLGLVAAMPDHGNIRPYVALAYTFGHLGQMMSPLHLCYVVSNEYFQAKFSAVYWRILLPAVCMAALGTAYFLLLRGVMK